MKKVLSVFLSTVLILTALCIFPQGTFAKENSSVKSVTELLSGKAADGTYFGKKEQQKLIDAVILRQNEFTLGFMADEKYEKGNAEDEARLQAKIKEETDKLFSLKNSIGNIDSYYTYYQLEYKTYVTYIPLFTKTSVNADYTFNYRSNADEELEVNKAVDDFFKTVDLNAISDYDLLKKIHDYINEKCTYDYSAEPQNSSFTPWGALCGSKAVCEGYTLAFYRLCKEAGLDVAFDRSDSVGNHAWNVVNLGGKCYYVDCTWDDKNDEGKYDYFLVDYDKLTADDTANNEHKNYDAQFDYDYLNDNYFSKADASAFSVDSKVISNCTINIDEDGKVESVVNPDGEVLENGVDYDVEDDENSFVKVVGKGDYSGYSSRKVNISSFDASLDLDGDGYSDTEYNPDFSIDGLTEGQDYVKYYYNNNRKGVQSTGTVVAYGIGKYTGVLSVDFEVLPTTTTTTTTNPDDSTTTTNPDDSTTTTKATTTTTKPTTSTTTTTTTKPTTSTTKATTTTRPSEASTDSSSDSSDVSVSVSIVTDTTKRAFDLVTNHPLQTVTNATTARTTTNAPTYSTVATTAQPTQPQTAPATQPTAQPTTQPALPSTTAQTKQTEAEEIISKKMKKASIKKLTPAKASLAITWSKVKGIKGYEIQLSTDKKFKKNVKSVPIKKQKTTKTTVKKLKSKKTYYVRIRTFKTQKVNGKSTKVYSSWSKAKSVKTK